jgi:DNA-binding beta-propeller fold protein YncE
LTSFSPCRCRLPKSWIAATATLLVCTSPLVAKSSKKTPTAEIEVPALALQGGRQLSYQRSFSSEREVKLKRGFWNRVLDIVAGSPDYHQMLRPYGVVTDSHGRIIVTDPGLSGIHVFDFEKQKYKFLAREGGRDPLVSPQCVAVDAQDNIYVTDSDTGKILVWDANLKYRRAIGSLKGGEGYFKRPTGIAVDTSAQHIYVSDTSRHKVFVLDMQGSVLQTIGKNGTAIGEFNFPTELHLNGPELMVVDAMNFRVQVFDRSGQYLYGIGSIGEVSGTMYRPKGVGVDSEGTVYVVDGIFDTIQAFSRKGELLYYFGKTGSGPAEFQLPTGLHIDHKDHIYVVDSFNHRVEVFQYSPAGHGNGGGQ